MTNDLTKLITRLVLINLNSRANVKFSIISLYTIKISIQLGIEMFYKTKIELRNCI